MKGLVVIVDGCNEEHIGEKTTPFFQKLKESGDYSRIKVTPSFAQRVEIMCGKSPLSTKTFVDFCYCPENLAFAFFKMCKPPLTLKRRNKMIRRIFKGYSFITSGHKVDFINIPLALLPYFCFDKSILEFHKRERERSSDHLFGVLERNRFEVKILQGAAGTVLRGLSKNLIGENKVVVLHYTDTDKIGHLCGPNSLEMKETLKSISSSAEFIYNSGRFDFIIIFGDHNMVEINKNVDLWGQLKKLRAKIIKDYLVFLNSPIARFWFNNNNARRELLEFLSSLDCGKIVTKEELREEEIPADEKYGQLIFWVKKGINISPDFYHTSEIKGMHSYLDDRADTPLIAYTKNKEVRLKPAGKLRDIAPTILDLAEINCKFMEGTSLVDLK